MDEFGTSVFDPVGDRRADDAAQNAGYQDDRHGRAVQQDACGGCAYDRNIGAVPSSLLVSSSVEEDAKTSADKLGKQYGGKLIGAAAEQAWVDQPVYDDADDHKETCDIIAVKLWLSEVRQGPAQDPEGALVIDAGIVEIVRFGYFSFFHPGENAAHAARNDTGHNHAEHVVGRSRNPPGGGRLRDPVCRRCAEDSSQQACRQQRSESRTVHENHGRRHTHDDDESRDPCESCIKQMQISEKIFSEDQREDL